MAIDTALAGTTATSEVEIDARWLMAYAAGIGRAEAVYLDTTRPGGVQAHPVFPVAPEWSLLTAHRFLLGDGARRDELVRAVHVGHRIVHHHPVRAGETVVLTGTIAGVERTEAGARVTVRFVAAADGEPRWTTWMTSIYRGVATEGPDVPPDLPGEVTTDEGRAARVLDRREVEVGPAAAHVYTECARIYNPIHTDERVARAAGLPGIILHGTASLAIGVSTVMELLDLEPVQVSEVTGSFRAMATLPSTLWVELLDATGDRATGAGLTTARFRVVRADGSAVVDQGELSAGA